jgi:hypothetical protein
MHSTTATQERLLEAGDLRVRFYWHLDRYAHEVSRRIDGDWRPLLTSIEGSPQDDWPASPPFQSLHIDERDDGRTLALLVGMAGKSHWSASIEIETREQEPTTCVSFDVACRVRDCPPGPLRSAYRAADPTASAAGGLKIELSHRYGPAELQHAGGESRVVAKPNADAGPQTIRWDYRLCADR